MTFLLPAQLEPMIAPETTDVDCPVALCAAPPEDDKGRTHVDGMGGHVSLRRILTADLSRLRFNDLVALLGVIIHHIKKGTFPCHVSMVCVVSLLPSLVFSKVFFPSFPSLVAQTHTFCTNALTLFLHASHCQSLKMHCKSIILMLSASTSCGTRKNNLDPKRMLRFVVYLKKFGRGW